MGQKTGNLALVVNQATSNEPDIAQRTRVEISNVLQTTLDIHQLLELFGKQIGDLIPHDGYSYVNENFALNITSGTRAHHSCHYNLVIEDNQLGIFTLMRRSRFEQQEIAQFESMLCYLVYPIRNALLYKQALQSARTDALTGTLNRATLDDTLRREWELARRQNTALSVIMIDIDYFKSINDQHGHRIGDTVLKTLANCIKHVVRKSDIVFRYGGEEFVVILSNTALQGAALLSERIRKSVESTKFDSIDIPINITASLGVSMLKHGECPHELLERADQAMYQAKHSGRNRVTVIT